MVKIHHSNSLIHTSTPTIAVVLESGQHVNYCFRYAVEPRGVSLPPTMGALWVGEHAHSITTFYPPLNGEAVNNGTKSEPTSANFVYLRIALLWRALITDSRDGRVNTIFGETILHNVPTPQDNSLDGTTGWRFVSIGSGMEERDRQPFGNSSTQAGSPTSLQSTFQIPWRPSSTS